MSKQKKNDEKLVRLALITVLMELLKAMTELIIKLFEIIGGN